jgi:hypothetical protein
MANRRIVCITKHPTHQDRYHRITHVGVGTDANKADEKLDVATVIRNIKSVPAMVITSWDPTVRKLPSLFEGARTVRTAMRLSPPRLTTRRKTTFWNCGNAVGSSSSQS